MGCLDDAAWTDTCYFTTHCDLIMHVMTFKTCLKSAWGAESKADHAMSVAGHARNIPEAGGEQSA